MKSLFFIVGVLATAASAANFQKTCRQVKVLDQYLSAICETTRGTEMCTEVDLSKCLLNVNGKIMFINDVDEGVGYPYFDERSPEFSRTGCKRCRSGDPSYFLYCDECPDGRSTESPVGTFDLSAVVDNQDGWLMCFRTRAAVKDITYCRNRDVSVYD